MGDRLDEQGDALRALLQSAQSRRQEADVASARLLSDLNSRRSTVRQQPRVRPPMGTGNSSANTGKMELPVHTLANALQGEGGQRDCAICLEALVVSESSEGYAKQSTVIRSSLT